MKWNDEYSIGIVEIDEQHKKLVTAQALKK